ncbi:MAG: VWA domain-containing protein [Bryobacteraceae bacterium]
MDATREFLKSQFQPDTWVAIFSLDSQLSVLQPFTTNTNEIMQAAANAFTGRTVDFASSAAAVLNASPTVVTIEVTMGGPQGAGIIVTQKITGGELNPLANNGADVATSAGANAMRGDLAEQRRLFNGIEAGRETDQILSMIGRLQALPGRKTVLLLSPGLASRGEPEMFKSMVDKANKANISFYALDVNGLSLNSNGLASGEAMGHAASLSATQGSSPPRNSSIGITVDPNTGSGSAVVNMEKMRQSDYVHDAVRTSDTQATLRALSEGTGGFLIGSTNDFRKPFQRLLEDVDTHYEAIYRPSSNKYDGHLRKIEVKTARADLSVESRTGYFALPALGTLTELASYELAALAALNVQTPPHTFALSSAAYQFRPAAGTSQDVLAFQIPAANLTATPEPSLKRHRMDVAVLTLVKDTTGQVVDKFSQDSPYDIPDDKLASAQSTDVMFTHPLSLPPGHYIAETAVVDREGNRASTKKIGFQSPQQNGVGMSSILLVQRLEPVNGKVDAADPMQFQAQPAQGFRVVPELVTSLSAGAHPNVYFVVYPDKSIAEKPKLQVELLVGGNRLAKQSADLPAPDATGAIPMVISAPAMAGACELRITAVQGNSQSMQSLAYTIAAK